MKCPACDKYMTTDGTGVEYCPSCGYTSDAPILQSENPSFISHPFLPKKFYTAINNSLSIFDEYDLDRRKYRDVLFDLATKVIEDDCDWSRAMPVVLAMIYYVIRSKGYPLSIRKFMRSVAARGVSTKAFLRAYEHVQEKLGRLAPMSPLAFLKHYLSVIGNTLRDEINALPGGMARLRELAKSLLNEIPAESVMGRRPALIAAAAIYIAIRVMSADLGYSRSVISEQRIADILELPRFSLRDVAIYMSEVLKLEKNKLRKQ